jgi:hypothetical protein
MLRHQGHGGLVPRIMASRLGGSDLFIRVEGG